MRVSLLSWEVSVLYHWLEEARRAPESPALSSFKRTVLAKALQEPWCWPSGEEEVKAAQRLLAPYRRSPPQKPPDPLKGQTCLVSVTPGQGRAALWVLLPRPEIRGETVPFVGTARSALQLAQQLAARYLPLLGDVSLLTNPGPWSARLIYQNLESRGTDVLLEGSSFGLSMCLGAASVLLGLPVPPSLAASAEVSPDGSLHPVDGLAEKLRIINEAALGVTTFLVAKEQEQEARNILGDKARKNLTSKGVSSLAEAFRLAWPGLAMKMAERWSDQKKASAAAKELFRIALESAPVLLDWRGVAEASSLVRAHLKEQGEARYQAEVAEAIARRHSDQPHPLPWPDKARLERLPRPLRIRLLAHVVQSAADKGDEEALQAVARVEEEKILAAPENRYAEDWMLSGAIGRALAASGEHERAREVLEETVTGWFRLYKPEHSTHALSEYIRVLGLLQEKAPLSCALRDFVAPLGLDRCHHTSLAFVHGAAGRACVQTGAWERAEFFLGEESLVDWSLTPDHLRRARLRWWGRVLSHTGREREAREAYQKLARETDDQSLLARLDLALRQQGGEIQAAWQALCQEACQTTRSWGGDVKRLLRRLRLGESPAPRDLARLIDEYRY